MQSLRFGSESLMEDKKGGKSGVANGRLRRRGRRERYWRAGGVSGGLDRHPTGLTAECLLLVMFAIVEGGRCFRDVEEGVATVGHRSAFLRFGCPLRLGRRLTQRSAPSKSNRYQAISISFLIAKRASG